MSLYTLKELNNKPAEIIRSLILEGYKIVPIEQPSNKKEFVAVLTKGNYTTDKYKLNKTVKDDKTDNDNDWLADHRERRECLKLISDKHGFR